MNTILIVEDDKTIFEELKKLFVRNGYGVLDGLIPSNLTVPFDLAVLDIGLPGMSGYEICGRIRETKSCPIVFLTSMDRPENEVMAFAAGGDDFIAKPFHSAVLIARIERLLKTRKQDSVLEAAGLTLDTTRLEARHGEVKIALGKTEFAILKILIEKKSVVSNRELIEFLWENESYIDENTLYVNMTRLREKLAGIGLVDIVRTVRGAGYCIGE